MIHQQSHRAVGLWKMGGFSGVQNLDAPVLFCRLFPRFILNLPDPRREFGDKYFGDHRDHVRMIVSLFNLLLYEGNFCNNNDNDNSNLLSMCHMSGIFHSFTCIILLIHTSMPVRYVSLSSPFH